MSRRAAEAAREAMGELDHVLTQRPSKDDHALSAAMAGLCLYRNALIEAARSGGAGARARLLHVNAVLSVVAAMQFPLGEAPWAELEGAAAELRELLADAP
jgi:hypothetical protein